MKKSILLTALAFVALGCSKTEVKPVEDAPAQISWNAVVGKASTKAMIDDTKYPVDEAFGTFAFFNENGQTFDANNTAAKTYILNAKVFNENKATSGAAWTTNPIYYWPKQGSLTFFSYSPYDKLANFTTCSATEGVTITDWDVDGNQDVDVMVADIKKDQTANDTNDGYTGVPTIFRHKLTQIVGFKIKTNTDYSNRHVEADAKNGDAFFTLNSISINGIQYKGTYNSTNKVDGTNLGAWTPDTYVKSYTWYESTTSPMSFGSTESAVETDINKTEDSKGYLLVLPQTFAENNGAYIEIQYTRRQYFADQSSSESVKYVDEPVTAKAYLYDIHSTGHYTDGHGTEHAFAMNKKITYVITVDYSQNVIYWAPSVEPWDDEKYTITF